MILVYLLISSIAFTRHPLLAAKFGDVTVLKYLGIACLLYALLYLPFRLTMPRFFATGQARWFVVLAFLATASHFVNNGPFDAFLLYVGFLVLFFITLVTVDSLSRLRWVLLSCLGSIGLASVYVIREWQKGHALSANFRPGWVVGDPNYFAISVVLCLPLAFYLGMEKRPWWERLFCWGCLLLGLAALGLGASRGGFLGLVTSFAFIVWNLPRKVRNFSVLGILLFAMLLLPNSPLRRLLHPTHSDNDAVEFRSATWHAALAMWGDHPIWGVGLGTFKPTAVGYDKTGLLTQFPLIAHNAYLEVAAELGTVGLVAFLATLVCTGRTLDRLRKQTGPDETSLIHYAAFGLEAGLAGAAISITFVSAEYQRILWLFVFLSMCMSAIQSQVEQEQELHSEEADIADSA